MTIPEEVASRNLVIGIQAVIDLDKGAVQIVRRRSTGGCRGGPNIVTARAVPIVVAQIVQIQDDGIDDGRVALDAGDNGTRAQRRIAAQRSDRLRVIVRVARNSVI